MGYINNLHISHEVVESSERAGTLSKAFSSHNRYSYKADAVLIGYAPLEPFMPIYLEGLKDRNSGIWVVITVNHKFDMQFPYSMHVHLGTNDQLLALPKPVGATHITNAGGDIKINEVNQPTSLMNAFKEKKGGHYYQETNNAPTLNNIQTTNPKVYDPVLDYLSTSSEGVNIYDIYSPTISLPKTRQWKQKY
jgi:hypothetical protein